MLRYMDNVAVVSVAYLRSEVFGAGSPVRRGTFIEDTWGKHHHMETWLASPEHAARRVGQRVRVRRERTES